MGWNLGTSNEENVISRYYPGLGAGILITGGLTPYVLGNYIEVVPASTITSNFKVYSVNVEVIAGQDLYILDLYQGTVGNESYIGGIRISKTTTPGQGMQSYEIKTPVLNANTRIVAKLGSGNGSYNLKISLQYYLV